MMLGAACSDSADELQAAWAASDRLRVLGAGAGAETIRAYEDRFYGWPEPARIEAVWNELFGGEDVELPADALLPWTEANYRAIRNTWRDGEVERQLRIVYTRLFAEMYESIVRDMNGGPSEEPA